MYHGTKSVGTFDLKNDKPIFTSPNIGKAASYGDTVVGYKLNLEDQFKVRMIDLRSISGDIKCPYRTYAWQIHGTPYLTTMFKQSAANVFKSLFEDDVDGWIMAHITDSGESFKASHEELVFFRPATLLKGTGVMDVPKDRRNLSDYRTLEDHVRDFGSVGEKKAEPLVEDCKANVKRQRITAGEVSIYDLYSTVYLKVM